MRTREEINARRRELRAEKREARMYDVCTDYVVKCMDNYGYHMTDVNRGDGYFIFYQGMHSTVTFKVKEAPGWRFGIWWSTNEDDKHHRVNGTVFTQYDMDVDKFKPARSSIQSTCSVYMSDRRMLTVNENRTGDLMDHLSYMMDFVVKHPVRAWARSTCGDCECFSKPWSDAYCLYRYIRHHIRHRRQVRTRRMLDRRLIRWVERNVLKYIDGAIIRPSVFWSPRFEIYVPRWRHSAIYPERGCYSLFWTEEECKAMLECKVNTDKYRKYREFAKVCPELERRFKAYDKRLERRGYRCGLYYSGEIHDSVVAVNRKAYERHLNESKERDDA